MTRETLVDEDKTITIKVSALRQGTVIDHLRRGTGLHVLELLGLEHEGTVTIGLNLDSQKLKQKDLIKIENRELTQEEVNKIAILSPEATLSIIRDFKVFSKIRPELADELEGLVRCLNPSCISNNERIKSRFLVHKRSPLQLRCYYCERAIPEDEIQLA
ncbi:MAG: aspartate carbamoyltransferase regulatory subunit [Planctomycetes bacterium]|nr:aspartate carbamoyltransferase regulatory subunit [Planctomycetota bacterium]